jgi:hypothetical protein
MTDQTPETPVIPLPDRSVAIDLDNLTRDEKEVKPPFVVAIKGRKITFTDPAEVDWQDLAVVEGPADIFRICLSKEDRVFFADQEIPGWKLNALFDAFNSHYDFDERVAKARRRAQF